MTNLNFAGIGLAVFFITLILTKKNIRTHDLLLAFFIFLLGVFLLIKYAFEQNIYPSYPFIIQLDIYYWVLLGPTLYIYTLLATSGENRLKIQYLFALIPAFLVTFFLYEYIFISPLELFDPSRQHSSFATAGILVWMYNSPLFYILTILKLREHKNFIKNHYSYTHRVNLNWLFYLSHGFAIFIFFLVIRFTILILFELRFPFSNYGISIIITTIYIFGIGYYGYKQKGIFDSYTGNFDNPESDESLTDNTETGRNGRGSYLNSGLTNGEAEAIIVKLDAIMKTEKLFLNSELDLPSLSDRLEVSTHKLSQVINEHLNKNFFDFVNEYRVEKAKELLSDPGYNQFTITSLAYESGFNSKSTFYNLFKKSEGIPPTRFRQIRQNDKKQT